MSIGDIRLTEERRADGAEFLMVKYSGQDSIAIRGGLTGAVAWRLAA